MDIGYHELRETLFKAGLPADPTDVLHRTYMFRSNSGTQLLVGSITAIDLSAEGGLQLHVTSPNLRGRPFLFLLYDPQRGWAARHPDRAEDLKRFDRLPKDASNDEIDAVSEQLIENRLEFGVLSLL